MRGERGIARRRGAFLLTTALLLGACALFGYLAWSREPAVVERTVAAPQAQPTAEQLDLARTATALAEDLRRTLAAMLGRLDPPPCEPGQIVDQTKLNAIRSREAENLTRWRKLASGEAG